MSLIIFHLKPCERRKLVNSLYKRLYYGSTDLANSLTGNTYFDSAGDLIELAVNHDVIHINDKLVYMKKAVKFVHGQHGVVGCQKG